MDTKKKGVAAQRQRRKQDPAHNPDSAPPPNQPKASGTTLKAEIAMTSSNQDLNEMKSVHLVLQGKGGVGKSFVSSLLYQFLTSKGEPVAAIDTDPVNATLAGYQAFGTKRLELIEGGSLNERKFDQLIETIINDDTHFVIDNGASSFIPLSYYIAENEAIDMIGEHGKSVVIHTVITGGQAMRDTLAGLDSLASQMPGKADIIVWLNEFFGDIAHDGKTFEEMKVYQQHKSNIRGIVRIARQTGATFGEDVKQMLDAKMTFDEVDQSDRFGLMAKSRLRKVRKSIFEQLHQVV